MTAEFHVHGPVIVGAGLAGLSCAIELAPAPCLVLSAGALSTRGHRQRPSHVV